MASIEKRVCDNGVSAFRVKVRLKGYPAQSATFTRLTDARRWAQQTEAAIREGRHFKSAEAKRRTLGEAIDRYIKHVLPAKPKSEEKQRAQLLRWRNVLGEYCLADVTPALIAEVRDSMLREPTARGEHRAPATVVRYLAVLSHLFTVAVKEWGWLEDNPMRKVRRPVEPRGRVRFLTDEERARLLQACMESAHQHLYPSVILALATGMRYGEIMSLTWDDVDLSRGRAILRDTKNGEQRAVHITGHALATLKMHATVRCLDSRLVFPDLKNSRPDRPSVLRDAWEAALKRAGIADFRFHDLRHCAASYLAMNGASLNEIAEVLGHKTLAMVRRYAHLSDTHVSSVVERMNARIFASA